MAALSSCLSTKIFVTRNTNKTLSPSTILARSDIGFSRSLTFKKLQFHHLIAKSHLASQVSTSLEKEITAPDISEIQTSNTARVKFQLQKEFMFGDQVFVVGDHPMLGLWNPTNAIPMNWSSGHIWNVELDVPVETTIQFKFVIKQSTGQMLWQPGPDRIFKTWESKATAIIAEDWENPEAQKITEELKPATAGNLPNQREEPMPNVDSNVMFTPDTAYAEEKLNIKGEILTREISTPKPVENEESLLGYEGQVLVPGLMTQQAVATDGARSQELGSHFSDSSTE